MKRERASCSLNLKPLANVENRLTKYAFMLSRIKLKNEQLCGSCLISIYSYHLNEALNTRLIHEEERNPAMEHEAVYVIHG